MSLLRCLIGTVLFATLGGCASEPPNVGQHSNVVVVLADTLRAQNLDLYGYERATAPTLAALATESIVFEQARAQAPCTFPSVNSLLTGLAPQRFLGQPDRRIGIPSDAPSLAEHLSEAGFVTRAVSASSIVTSRPTKFNPHGGFESGFDQFDMRCEGRRGDCVTEAAVELLDGVAEPFFLYLHYMDPHGPYRGPDDRPARFAGEGHGLRDFVRQGDPNPAVTHLLETGDSDLTERELDHLVDLYDEEILSFDLELGRLLGALRERDLYDRTLLWVVADHGEAFLEHGQLKHCRDLYDTEIRTPMLLRLPGQTSPRRLGSAVGNIDLVPTTLDLLGLTDHLTGLDGTSLRPTLDDGETEPRLVFSSWSGTWSAFDGRFKLILRRREQRTELFDVLSDRTEKTDLSETHPDVVRRLARGLAEWIDQVETDPEAGRRAADQLRALGYIQ